MSGMQKTKQRQNTKPEEVATIPEGYESLTADSRITNDAMSGWRTQLGTMNGNYQYTDENGNLIADIRGYGNSAAFKEADVTKQNQYYTDLANFNALYNNVAGYDADYLKEAEKAKQAEEYANTRRMLMERYMPETLAAMGYANTGLAGDAVLKINNKYDNYILNAQKEASDNQSDLMTTYREKAMEIESGINAEKQGVLKAQQELYNEYLEKIYNGEGLDSVAVEAAVQLGALTPEQRDELFDISSSYSLNGIKRFDDVELKQNTSDKQYLLRVKAGDGAEEVIAKMNENNSGVYNGGSQQQKAFLNDVLTQSMEWGPEMNGTLVDFNYGWKTKDADKPSIYVFKDGTWYLTTLSRAEAWDDDKYKDRFFTGTIDNSGWLDWTVRGNNWRDIGNYRNTKLNESKTETK